MMKKKALSGIIASTLSISLLTSMSPTTYLSQAYAGGDKDDIQLALRVPIAALQ